MKITKITFYLFLLTAVNIFSQNFVNVADMKEYNAAIKNAKPGTTIILKDGVWEDVNIKAYGKGTAEAPITIKAKRPGKVIISGDSRLQIYGEYIVVEGLWFKDGSPTNNAIISFKKSDEEFANNCRFTNNAISYYNPNYSKFKSHWVALWGKNNRVDHNNFTGKKNEGSTLVVWLKGDAHTENNHRIDSNHFGPRPFLDKTNAETIRIGTSKNSMKSSRTIVENNTFEKCDAELEIISNKSCNNIFRNNLFIGSQGTLTLRHGNDALVENNVFMGNGVSKAGGIRIINEGHIIRNNLFVGIKGSGNRGPITIMNGIPNSALNRYHQVKNVSIQNNTLVNCSTIQLTDGKNEERTLAPINTLFANNLIVKGTMKVSNASDDDTEGITFKNNIVETTGEFDRYSFANKKIDWSEVNNIPMPKSSNKFLITDFKNDKSPTYDITGSLKSPFVIGAFNLDNTKLPKALTHKSGPSWDTTVERPKYKGRIKTVEPGAGTLAEAIKKASENTFLKLRDGVYFVSKEMKISDDITIQGNKKTIIRSKDEIEKPFKSFFKINENSSLTLKNVTIDGAINDVKYAVVSPSTGASAKYNLFVDNCVFKNFNNKGGYIIKGYTNTVADTISIKNSYFLDSYRGVTFSSKENINISANTVLIENTVFKNIEGNTLKYNKPTAMSKKQGELTIRNSIFYNVNNSEKGKVLEAKDLGSSVIENCVFEANTNMVTTLNLSGTPSKVNNCLIYNSGELKDKKGISLSNIVYKKPKWKDKENFTPNRRSPLLKFNNNVGDIGLTN